MNISKDLLKILVCPVTKQKLIYDKENEVLVSPNAALAFPIVNGIPMMLADEAKPVSQDRITELLEKEKKDQVHKQELLETKSA